MPKSLIVESVLIDNTYVRYVLEIHYLKKRCHTLAGGMATKGLSNVCLKDPVGM